MPKGRGSNERRRNQRQSNALWLAKHGDPERIHHNLMVKMTQGTGVKGPCVYGMNSHIRVPEKQ